VSPEGALNPQEQVNETPFDDPVKEEINSKEAPQTVQGERQVSKNVNTNRQIIHAFLACWTASVIIACYSIKVNLDVA